MLFTSSRRSKLKIVASKLGTILAYSCILEYFVSLNEYIYSLNELNFIIRFANDSFKKYLHLPC